MSSNRVDLSSSVSLHIEVFAPSCDFVLTSIGLARYASAPCRPLDARISCLFRFPMICPLSEDGFFSPVPGLNCFNPASLREMSPLRIQPLLLAHLSLATLICLEQECDIAATPCSPFGPGRALLPFPSQGRFQLQYPPSHGSLTSHCCVVNQPAQDCALKDFSADFSRLNCYATISFSRSLRSPYGFQCFPSTAIIARCLCC